MKKFLALTLVLCTLLCLFPAAVSAEAAEPVAENESTGSYLDLYVKEGLVALYDAYSGVAAEAFEGTGTWNAVDFYEKEGYDDYAPLSTSMAYLYKIADKFVWKWEDGYLSHLSHSDSPPTSGVHRDGQYSFMDLNILGEELLADASAQLTVQQVYQLLGGPTATQSLSTPVIEGDKVINYPGNTRYSTYGGKDGAGFTIGNLTGGYTYHAWAGDGKYTQGGVWSVFFQDVATNLAACYNDSAYFMGDYYNVTLGTDLVDADGASLSGRWVRRGEMGVVTETITRTNSTSYNANYREALQYTNGNMWTNWPCTVTESTATTLSLLRGLRARIYSVRIYNTVLTDAQNDQNHFADLLGFYGVNVSGIELLSAEGFANLVDSTKDLSIVYTADKTDEDYVETKEALQNALKEALEAITAELESAAESAVAFGGIAYRTSGDFGIRALFSVDTDAIALLEAYGFTVTYGAIVAVGTNGDTVVNASAEELTVDIDADTGKVVIASGKGAAIASDSDTFKHLTDANVSFAATVTFNEDGSQSDLYDATLIYRGFVVIRNAEGNGTIIYDDAVVDGLDDISLISIHEKALTDTTGMPEELIARLESILPTEE